MIFEFIEELFGDAFGHEGLMGSVFFVGVNDIRPLILLKVLLNNEVKEWVWIVEGRGLSGAASHVLGLVLFLLHVIIVIRYVEREAIKLARGNKVSAMVIAIC